MKLTADSASRRAALLRQAVAVKRAQARPEEASLPKRPAGEPARLSPFQESLWLQHLLAPGASAYNLVSAYRVPRGVDRAALERAIRAVTSRHRILHATFRAEGGSAVHVIPAEGAELTIERVSAEPGELVAAATREAGRPFDLETGPLLRCFWVEAGAERAIALVMHHILADERSLLVLWDEIAAAYHGSALEPDPRQFTDYLYWLESRGEEQAGADRAYWRERLAGASGEQSLPFAKAAAAESMRGRLLLGRVGGRLAGAVKSLAAEAGATPFAVYAFAFQCLLQRAIPENDWAYATPATKRLHPAAGRMVGYFLNPVPVQGRIDEQVTVGQGIVATARDLRERIAHASIPLHVLGQEVAEGGRAPFMQAMFVHQEAHPRPTLGGLELEPLTLDLGEAKFDLTWFVSEGAGAFELGVEYRTELFEAHWMERLLRRYEALLRGLTRDASRRVADVSEMPADEAAEVRSWSTGAPLQEAGALAPERILRCAERTPEAAAVVSGGESWSYADLAREGLGIAAALAERGVSRGDRVGLYVQRSAEMIAGLVGALWSGAAYVPLDPAYPSARVAATLGAAAVRAVVADEGAEPPEGEYARVPVKGMRRPGAWAPVSAAEEDPAYLLYTSGSTGAPKGVVVTHANLRASTAAREQYYGDAPKRFLLLSSIGFDSSVAGVFWTLSNGGALVIPSNEEARDPRLLARLIAEQRVDALLCVPQLYAAILAERDVDLGSLRMAVVAGESCPRSLVEEHFRVVPGARLFNEYGPTEATVWATVEELTEKPGAPVGIGGPIPGVMVESLDGLGRAVAPGTPGECWISGPTVAAGYWGNTEATAERFVDRARDDGTVVRSYRTGDRVSWTADGRLLFLGRVDNQVKLRGFRIEPGEIEAALLEAPGVEEAVAAVCAVGAVEQLVAFVVSRDGVNGLRERLVGRLPEYMIPSRFVVLDELPRTPNGKADRGRLREIAPAAEGPRVLRDRVLSERKQALVSLWEGLLGISGVETSDNFIRLGGHSLLVVRMASALARDFGVDVSPAELFQHPTIDEIDRLIESRGRSRGPEYRHLFPIQTGGEGFPLIFAIPHFFADLYSRTFRGKRPVYGLRGVGIRPGGNRGLWPSMEALGEDLADEVLRRFPELREVAIAGYSFGASMGFELTRVLEQRGVAVRELQLITPMALDSRRFGPLSIQLDGLRKPLEELSTGEALALLARANQPWTMAPYRRLRRFLLTRTRRKILCAIGDQRKKRGLELSAEMLHADVRLERFRLQSRYRPETIEAPTVIFNGMEPETDAAATWRSRFNGPLRVVDVTDPHLGAAAMRTAEARIREYLVGEIDW